MRQILAIMALALAGSALGQSSAWDYRTQTDISGKVTEFATSSSLVVRCSSKCEVFFTPDKYTLVEDQGSVLVKFNDKPAKRYGVSRSEDDTALFFSDPVTILRAIRDNGGYMTIEYKPYEKIPDTVKYEVWYLPPTILMRIAETKAKKDALRPAAIAFAAHAQRCAELSEKLRDVYSHDWSASYEMAKKEGCPPY